ncbi:MAG: hypothetical protein VYB45_10120 [Pseudomonadota bacterium]|nr:hypothetical protein [Pseudomonadota bacterium]
MVVLLRRPDEIPSPHNYDAWASIGDSPADLPTEKRDTALGANLEKTFDEIAEVWMEIGRALSAEPTGDLSHTAACVPNLSDFGFMMAWSRIAAAWAKETRSVLLVTDDPWLFRHLAKLEGIEAGRMPRLYAAEAKLALRGFVARIAAALRFAKSAISLRAQRKNIPRKESVILVYAHPESSAEGVDGYFGDLMLRMPGLGRVLHVDCPAGRARKLSGHGTTASLHAWGSAVDALGAIFARWRPARRWREHPEAWLVRRAACREGGTATGAAIRWQQSCQRRWLSVARPNTVTWPWENHAWERDFVRSCRAKGITTIGYQHSVVGNQMLNYAPISNPDGLQSIPDKVLCTGNATATRLTTWGLPEERVSVGGAWRAVGGEMPVFDRQAPVLMALPFDARISAEMIAAANAVHGRKILVKSHPMTPYWFADTTNVRNTNRRLGEHDALSAVVYAASTVGLEAVLAGIPTYRFRPQTCLAIDVLPDGVHVDLVDRDSLAEALDDPQPSPAPDRAGIFAPVEPGKWQKLLERKGPNAELA